MTAPLRRTSVQCDRDTPGEELGNIRARELTPTDHPITSGCSVMVQARPWNNTCVGRTAAGVDSSSAGCASADVARGVGNW